MQIGDRRGAAHAAALGELITPDAVLLRAVEVLVVRQSGLPTGLDERFAGAEVGAAVDHAERSADAVELALAALVVLGLDEVREHVVPAPALVAHLRPAVVIGAVAADVDHRVDRGGPSERPATGQIALTAGEAGLGIGDQRPVVLARRDRQRARGQVDLVGAVRRTCLEQADLDIGVFGQPSGQHAAGRAGSDDHVVIATHPASPRARLNSFSWPGGASVKALVRRERSAWSRSAARMPHCCL